MKAEPSETFGLPGVRGLPKQRQVELVAERYLRTFNTAFGRRVSSVTIQKAITARIAGRLKDEIEPELLVSLPLLSKATGGEEWASKDPTILLRDGKHARTRDGQTLGATDHAVKLGSQLDQITLKSRLAEAAEAAGVDHWLEAQGVRLLRKPPEPPTEAA